MDCDDFCAIGGLILAMLAGLGLMLLLMFSGAASKEEDIMEKCDKVGEFTIQEYTYECKLKEEHETTDKSPVEAA